MLVLLDCRAPDLGFELSERFGWVASRAIELITGGVSAEGTFLSKKRVPPGVDQRTRDEQWLRYKRPLLRYRPKPFNGKVALLLSSEYFAMDVQESWKKVKTDWLEVTQLKGDHYSYIRDHAEDTAKMISMHLSPNKGLAMLRS
jgi:hypothetical protein